MTVLNYPVNGYAPGNYSCICYACDQEFNGDKRAIACEPCAMELLERGAEHFAREKHEGQEYGGESYVDGHVAKVVAVLKDFGVHPAYVAAGWLHDVIEDTPTSREDIARKFGEQVASLVWACTGIGPNRRARNEDIYQKIEDHPQAAIVKVADRIANVEASDPESGHRSMYRKEAVEFAARVASNVPQKMITRLEEAYVS